MKISFAVAMLLQTSQSIRITDPKVEPKSWDPKTLQACPTDPARTILDDGKTHVAKYPFVGASCKLQTNNLIQLDQEKEAEKPKLKSEREAIKAQKDGAAEGAEEVKEGEAKPDEKKKEGEKKEEGKEGEKKEEGKEGEAPKEGEAAPKKEEKRMPNTPRKMITSETDPAAADYRKILNTLQHCPDFNERFSLQDGATRAIPYPQMGFNCNPDYTLNQRNQALLEMIETTNLALEDDLKKEDAENNKGLNTKTQNKYAVDHLFNMGADPKYKGTQRSLGTDLNGLEHCPDFDERMTLADGRTRAVAYPEEYFNCNPGFALGQFDRHDMGSIAADVAGAERCPDALDKTDLLTDGKTRAIPYPKTHWNCKQQFNGVTLVPKSQQAKVFAQQQEQWVTGPNGKDMKMVGADTGAFAMEHCPDFDERFTLANGQTRAIAYPQPGYNCNPAYSMHQFDRLDMGAIAADVASSERCPDALDKTDLLTDGVTRAIPYPKTHWNCKQQFNGVTLVPKSQQAKIFAQQQEQWVKGPDGKDLKTVGADTGAFAMEHCPDFDERMTLANGQTKAIAYPAPGYNCNPEYSVTQKSWVKGPDGKDLKTIGADTGAFAMEHCPDFDERMTLANGQTKAIAYPAPGYNCNPAYSVTQQSWVKGPDGTNIKEIHDDTKVLEHCPDFNERFTLADGKTRGIPYPQPGYNCNGDYALAKKSLAQASWVGKYDGTNLKGISADTSVLEHCPDFDERWTLKDGLTRGIPYPQTGYNCNPDYAIVQNKVTLSQQQWVAGPNGKDLKMVGADTGAFAMEHCPDFDERFTLANGQTRAIAYPQPGYNCNPAYSLSQETPRVPSYEHLTI